MQDLYRARENEQQFLYWPLVRVLFPLQQICVNCGMHQNQKRDMGRNGLFTIRNIDFWFYMTELGLSIKEGPLLSKI